LNSADVTEVRTLTGIVLGLAAMTQLGCLNDCQRLCDSWYEFREVVCEDSDVSAELNRCLSDYHTLPDGGQDEAFCRQYLDFVDGLDTEDELYCGDLVTKDVPIALQL